jgi:hypothetical protein
MHEIESVAIISEDKSVNTAARMLSWTQMQSHSTANQNTSNLFTVHTLLTLELHQFDAEKNVRQ